MHKVYFAKKHIAKLYLVQGMLLNFIFKFYYE